MHRNDIIDRLWQDSPLFLTREAFQRTFDGWDFHEVEGDTAGLAVVVTRGPEFHFAILEDGFQVTRAHLRRWPGELIARHGYAQTRTPKEDARQLRFNRRLGFEVIGEDAYDVHQRITRLRVKD